MTVKKVKWYNLFWVRFGAIILFIALLIYGATDTVAVHNLNEYLKTTIEDQIKEQKKADIKIEEQEKLIQKLKTAREKIYINENLDKIKSLEKQLEELRKQQLPKVEKIEPEKLNKYFQDLLKEK